MSKAAVFGLSLFALCAAVTVAQERFANALDGIDVDRVLASRRLVTNYVACLTHKRPCPPQIAEIKRALPEIMKTTCVKCTRGQVLKIAEGLTKLKKIYPDEFRKLSEVWDPTGDNFRRFIEKAKNLTKQGSR